MTSDGAASPPTPSTPAWLLSYEQAQERANRAVRGLANAAEPAVDLKPGVAALKHGLASLYTAIDQRGDRLSETRAALDHFAQSITALADAARDDPMVAHVQNLLEQARELASAAEAHFSRLPAAPPPAPRPLRASTSTLSLHDVPRASLGPFLRVPEPPAPPPIVLPALEPPRDVDALAATMQAVAERAAQRRAAREEQTAERERARLQAATEATREPPEGFSGPIDLPLSEYAVARERLRECLEEVSMLGSQRLPLQGDDWRSISFLDQRLMTNVDAVASLGAPALHAIEELVADSPVKDPARCFGAVLLLGCIDGRDTLAAAERVIRHMGAEDPQVAAYAAHALALVPHPHLGLAMRSWLTDAQEAYRAVAVEVLARRGLASEEELLAATRDPSPAVASKALPALALLAPGSADLSTALVEASAIAGCRHAAWLAMVLSHHPRAMHEALDALDGPEADAAAAILALGCDATIAASLLHRCNKGPTPALVEAVGVAGSPSSVDDLIALLRHDDPEVAIAAGASLHRLTGIELFDEAEVDPDTLMVPEPPLPDVGDLEPPPPPLAQQISDPRDAPSEGSPDTVVRPSTDGLRWRKEWEQRRRDMKEGARYRRGHPYSPLIALWELNSAPLSASRRLSLQHELVVRSGRYVRFHPADFVAAQEAALVEWETIARAAASSPGGWSRPGRRA